MDFAFIVKSPARVRVAEASNLRPGNTFKINDCGCRDFTGKRQLVGAGENFDGDAAVWILSEDSVEYGVADLVTDFVWVACTD